MSAPDSLIVVQGLGAVTPAGWGVPALRGALDAAAPALPVTDLPWPGSARRVLRARRVPAPPARPAWLAHPRLRRSSAITHHAVGAALEALGPEAARVAAGEVRLGVVVCVMTGCAGYSRRFYDEVLRDPATASPLLFPETVFNAPASHLAAVLGATGLNYTLVGDPSAFAAGLGLAAHWLEDGDADAVVVVGAEEADWTTAEALRLFSRGAILAEGAGALCLRRASGAACAGGVRLAAVTDPQEFGPGRPPAAALRAVRRELPAGAGDLLVPGAGASRGLAAAEARAWADWAGPRIAPARVFGEGFMAAAAWQCVVAVDRLQEGRQAGACVSVPGSNHAAAGVRFARIPGS
ncbi:MAG: hypothetical protein RJA22_890 [Verrucomicrobiota bacterium]|jgi:hypothetical protein